MQNRRLSATHAPRPFAATTSFSLLWGLIAIGGCASDEDDPGRVENPSGSGTAQLPADFGGSYLLALSDTDTLASAYVDDQIGPPIEARDALTIVRLGDSPMVSALEVSNSVWAPPTMAVSPDGSTAYILEIREQREAGDESFEEDLALSTRMSVVDISDPQRPSVVEVVDLGGFAGHYIDINARGDTLAITNWAEDAQLILVSVSGTEVDEPQRFSLGIQAEFAFPNTVEWHPDDTTLGVVVGPLNLAAFFSVSTSTGGRFQVDRVGDPVPVGLFPFTAFWSRDGSAFITADMNWNIPLGVTDFNNSSGSFSVILPDLDGAGGVSHQVIPGPAVPANPEGLAVSPDGSLLVSVNLERSHLPDNPSQASLSLLSFEESSGRLAWRGDYPVDGVLPEGIVFDTSGRYIAVAVFDGFNEQAGAGRVEVWQVAQDDEGGMSLEITDFGLPLPRGAHTLALIP